MLTINAPAKINLALDVTADRPDGYHEVDMALQSLELADQLFFKDGVGLELSCSNPDLPTDRSNLVRRAAELLREVTGTSKGAVIHIEKRIPIAAGLAGGSADAAAALKGLNILWGLRLSPRKLLEIGLKLGADVPFCLTGHTVRAQGIGEILTPVDSNLSCRVLLITPDIRVSTALVYRKLNTGAIRRRPQMERVLEALNKGDLELLASNWGNVLEEVTLTEFPEVARLKELMFGLGLQKTLMSGSGPTIFTLDAGDEAIDLIRAAVPATWSIIQTNFESRREKWNDNR